MREVAVRCGLSLSDADLESFRALFGADNVVDAMPDEVPPVTCPRTPGYRPRPDENRHNAW
jgi:amidase